MAVFTVVVAIFIFVLIWFWGDRYPDFNDFKAEIKIPGLKDGAAPQGLASHNFYVPDEDGEFTNTDKRQDYYFISAYFKNKPSRIYVVGKDTGYIGYVSLKDTDGNDFMGHCGGIAINSNTLWVASGSEEAGKGNVFVYKEEGYSNVVSSVISKAMEKGEIQFTTSFAANCNASFLCYYRANPNQISADWQDRLYVGEFYRSGNYETDKRHRVTTIAGDKNTAFVYEYDVSTDSSNEYGLERITKDNNANDLPTESKVPRIQNIYSITKEIQGMALTKDGKLVLSQSYGLKNSVLYYHDWNKVTDNKNKKSYTSLVGHNFQYEDVKTDSGKALTVKDLQVYFVDKSTLVDKFSIPSMSEGLCVTYENGVERVNVLFESGAKKYKTFVRQILKEVYSFVPRKIH